MLHYSWPASSYQWIRSALWHFWAIVKGKLWDSNDLVARFFPTQSDMFGWRRYWKETDDQTTAYVSRRSKAPAGSDGSPRDMLEETAPLYENVSGILKVSIDLRPSAQVVAGRVMVT